MDVLPPLGPGERWGIDKHDEDHQIVFREKNRETESLLTIFETAIQKKLEPKRDQISERAWWSCNNDRAHATAQLTATKVAMSSGIRSSIKKVFLEFIGLVFGAGVFGKGKEFIEKNDKFQEKIAYNLCKEFAAANMPMTRLTKVPTELQEMVKFHMPNHVPGPASDVDGVLLQKFFFEYESKNGILKELRGATKAAISVGNASAWDKNKHSDINLHGKICKYFHYPFTTALTEIDVERFVDSVFVNTDKDGRKEIVKDIMKMKNNWDF